MDFIMQLKRCINNFLDKGHKPEDCIIIMGITFHDKFLGEIPKPYIAYKAGRVNNFGEILVNVSTYINPNDCFIIDQKQIQKDVYDPYKPKFSLEVKDEGENRD